MPVFYYSLLLNVDDINAAEIFLLEPKGRGEEGGRSLGLFYCLILSGYTLPMWSIASPNLGLSEAVA